MGVIFYLQILLPFVCDAKGVSKLIHDNNRRVRVAFGKLLRLVKGVRSIKYYHVVPVDHILARLAEDHLRCVGV